MSEDDEETNGRDARGRWKKGFCPNPKGRPRKELEFSDADIGWFKQGIVEVMVNGEMRKLTRQELLLHSMYDQAIKGKSALAARKLLEYFMGVDRTWAEAHRQMRERSERYLHDYYEHGKVDNREAQEILALSDMWTFGLKPKPPRKPRIKAPAEPATWRTNPKPQSLLDLEKEEAEAEAKAEAAASGPRHEPCKAPDGAVE